MALKFAKKNKDETGPDAGAPATGQKPKFLTGSDAKKALDNEEAKAAAKAAMNGKAFRFRIPFVTGAVNETQLTFLDGDIDSDGILNVPFMREHTLKKDGQWTNILCTEDSEGYCPICEKGENASTLVGYLSVLDHTPYTPTKGPNAGKTIDMQKRLFVAKRGTLQILTKQAIKRDGLAGCTFEVSRTGDREAAVGNQFEFVQKDVLAELQTENGWKPEDIVPLDYSEELPYFTAAQLAEMGLGPALSGPGTQSEIDESDLANQM